MMLDQEYIYHSQSLLLHDLRRLVQWAFGECSLHNVMATKVAL